MHPLLVVITVVGYGIAIFDGIKVNTEKFKKDEQEKIELQVKEKKKEEIKPTQENKP